MTEPIRITRISTVGGKVRLAVCKTKRGQGTTTKSFISEDLTEVYEKRGKQGLDNEILRLCAKEKLKLIGSHKSLREYKEILSNPENLKMLAEEQTDILLDEIRTKEEFTGKTYAIRINGNDFLAGVLTVKIGEHVEYVPYGTKDMPNKSIKYFILREQAQAYLKYIREHCESFYHYKMEIVEKVDSGYTDGLAKIAKWCDTHRIPMTMPKKPVVDKDRDVVTRTYRFPNREYKLLVELYRGRTVYKFMRRSEVPCESNRQLDIMEEMGKYKLK